MKHAFLILITVLVTSCALDRQTDYDIDYALEFQPAMYMHVYAEGTDRYPADLTFGVCAWSLSEKDSWKEDSQEAEVFLPLTEALPLADGKTWAFDETVMWPSRHERVTFLAYSPYEAEGKCDPNKGICYENVDVATSQTDLLYTDPIEDMSKMECGGVVSVPFRHALCGINFRIKNRVNEKEKIIIKKIELDQAKHCGDFCSLAEPQWSLRDETMPFVFFEGTYQTGHHPAEIGRSILMLPQKLDTEVTVEYDYVTEAGTFITQKLKTTALQKTLQPGKNYTFTITVGIDDVKFLVEIIEDLLYI